MIQYLSRLTAERDSLTEAANELTNKAAGEERDLTDTERSSMTAWQERCATIDAQLVEYNAQAESQRAYARLRGELDAPHDEPPARRNIAELEVRGWGDLFVESDAFRGYTGRGSSESVMVPGPFEERAEITTALPAPWVTPPFVYTPATFQASTPLLDVIGKVTTGLSAVQWLQWAPNPAPAAPVVAEGAAKPEMAMTPTAKSDSLDTYAHWKGITRQALEDIPQIRSIVEGRLRQGILTALEAAVSAALQGEATIPTQGGSSMMGAIRSAVAVVETNGYGPANAVLLNPADFADLDIAAMATTNNGPVGTSSYWGLRPVAVPSLPAGTAYVGNMGTAVQLFTRGQTALYLTDSHDDYFIRNIVLLLAEIRALATVPDPLAAVKITGITPAGTQAAAPSGGR
jgi:HK97 family phage major capsid protein